MEQSLVVENDDAKTELRVYVDANLQILHLLDMDSGGRTLTNAVPHIQDHILNKLQVEGEANEWMWICYPTDGVVYAYQGAGSYRHIPLADERLYAPFAGLMEARKQVYR